MDTASATLAVLCASTVAVMVPFEAQTLIKAAAQRGRGLGWPRALAFALCSTTAGVAAFAVVVPAIGLGLPYLLGDTIGLPWLMALPGLIGGFWAGRATNRKLIAFLMGPVQTGHDVL